MSYDLKIDRKARTVGRYLGMVHRALVNAAIDEKKRNKLTQRQLADKLGVNVSVVNRILRGDANLTSRKIAELAWALGRTPEFRLLETKIEVGCNHADEADATIVSVNTRTENNAKTLHPTVRTGFLTQTAPTEVRVASHPAYELADV